MDRPPHVTFHYERTFPYPMDVAYQWLTDYQDDDPQRAGGMVRRRDVVRRSDREVEVDGELEVMGQRRTGRATIDLYPEEHRWVAHIGRAWEFHYKLVPEGKGVRLLVDYNMASRRWSKRAIIRLARPLVMRRIDRMWRNFDASMRRELGPPAV